MKSKKHNLMTLELLQPEPMFIKGTLGAADPIYRLKVD